MIRSIFAVPTVGGDHGRRRYRRRYYGGRRYSYDRYRRYPYREYNGCYDYYDDGNEYYEC